MKKRKKGKRPPGQKKASRKAAKKPAPSPASAIAAPIRTMSEEEVRASLSRAAQTLQDGKAEEALALCRAVLASTPDNAEALNLCGVAAFHIGDAVEAVSLLQTAVSFRPDFADAHNNLGNVFKAMESFSEAEAAYRQALAVRPDYLSAEYNLGIVLEAQGRFADAEGSYRKCLKLDSGFAPAHFNLGNVAKALGRLDEAGAAYRKAIDNRPDFAEALNNLGTVEMELSRPQDAIHAYRKAIGARGDFADAHYNLGIALQEEKEFDAAIESYSKALGADAAHAGAQINIGYALKELGKLEGAVDAYKKAIAMAPDYDKVRANLGDVYLQKGDGEAALEVCDAYLAEHPGNITMLAFKAIVCEELGRKDDVRELYDFDRLIRPVEISAPDGFDDMAAFNEALSQHVLAHPSLVYAPKSHATRFGRHSGELLAEPKGPMAALEKTIMAAVEDYRRDVPPDPAHAYLSHRPERVGLNAWGVVMDTQGHQLAHIHPSAWLSGVYYPKVPAAIDENGEARAGWIEFGRAPDDFHWSKQPEVKFFKPQEGLMILFPSYFYHRTLPFEAPDPRISIAFDVVPGES